MLDDKIKVLEAIKELFYKQDSRGVTFNDNSDVIRIAGHIGMTQESVNTVLYEISGRDYLQKPRKLMCSRGEWTIYSIILLDEMVDNYKQEKEEREHKALIVEAAKNSAKAASRSATAAVILTVISAIAVTVSIISIWLRHEDSQNSQSDLDNLRSRVTTLERRINPTPSTP